MNEEGSAELGDYRIYDAKEEQQLAQAENLDQLFANFLENVYKHNIGVCEEDNIEGFKDEVDFKNAANSFRYSDLKVQRERKISKTEWRDVE